MKCDELKQEENPIEWGLYYDKDKVDAAIAELKTKLAEEREFGLNRAKSADHEIGKLCAELCGLTAENRKHQRALWLARAEMARTSAWVFWNRKDDYNYNKWKKVERKCRAKAEEYK